LYTFAIDLPDKMFSHFKTRTAVFICLAFVFQLLFVGLNPLLASNAPHTKYVSAIPQKRRYTEAVSFKTSTPLEIYEEDSDTEENLKKANLPVIACILSSFLQQVTSFILK
jgi:hypothetical protein